MQKPALNIVFPGILALLVLLIILAFVLPQSEQISTVARVQSTSQSETVMTSTYTVTPLPTQTPVPPSSTPLPPIATITPIPTEHYILGFTGHKQYYSIGCEASAAVDLAEFMGVPLLQYDVQMALPISDNPDFGFVGDVNTAWGYIPPNAYGVHAAPIRDVLNQMGVLVEGGKGYTLEQIKAKLAQNKPVIVWVIGSMEYSDPVEYTDKQGNTTIVAPYEHVVILTGYNPTSVRYVSNGRWADAPNEVFLTSWGVLGNMAVMPD